MRYDMLLRSLQNKLARQTAAREETMEHIQAIEKLHAQDAALNLQTPAPPAQEKNRK